MSRTHRPRAIAHTLASALLAGIAAAQGQPDASSAASRARETADLAARRHEEHEIRDTLDARDRQRMHPGNPLEISSAFTGDNDAFARTPLLANGTYQPVPVDTEELRERALAAYADRSLVWKTAPESQITPRSTPRAAPPRAKPVAETPNEPVVAWRWPAAAVALALAAVGVGWILRRRTRDTAGAAPARARASAPAKAQTPFELVTMTDDVSPTPAHVATPPSRGSRPAA